MLEIKRVFNQLHRKIFVVMLAALVWLISLPTISVQAEGYFSTKTHKVEVTKPYYTTRDRNLVQTEPSKPYYSTKERSKVKVTAPGTGDDYIESGKRAGEVIPKDLETGNRQKNPISMLKRASGELGNNQPQ
jgi:hypothetical protein